ncbi:MAG: transaldolase [Dongiaceae bacterium]
MAVSERIKLFADGADLPGIARLAADPAIRGFTTNPTLMRAAGVLDYAAFADAAAAAVAPRPISLEVFADDFDEMHAQARLLAAFGANVYVKIPVTDTRGRSTVPLIKALVAEGVRLNVTALLTLAQVTAVRDALSGTPGSFVSVFAGRIADTGRDPLPLMRAALEAIRPDPAIELIWASSREVYNIYQAAEIGCHIITVTADLLRKLALEGKDLSDLSLDTVRMFRSDAVAAGYRLHTKSSDADE